jgi:hypothetical protein
MKVREKVAPRVAPRNMSLVLRDCTADQVAILAVVTVIGAGGPTGSL